MDIVQQIRDKARRDKVTTYRLAKDSRLSVSIVQRIIDGGGANCGTAEKLARVLGCTLELRLAKRAKRK